jgi:hypothetical protein
MDKQLLKAYIRTIVEEEVKRILPEILSEAVTQVKRLSESTAVAQPSKVAKTAFDRKRLAELIGYDGDTLVANTGAVPLPENAPRDVPPEIINAVTKDYSQMMKKMGLT